MSKQDSCASHPKASCSPIRSLCISCRFNGKSNRRTSDYPQFSREILEDPMADNSLDKIRIDHIGSLVRPAKLREVFARYDRGQATHEELVKAQDAAIREVIQKQEAHGFPV